MNKERNLLKACDERIHRNEIEPMVHREKDDYPIIYFLVNDNQIVYIGQSRRPVARFKQHLKEGIKEFDYIYFKKIPDIVRLVRIESLCLHYLDKMTKYNRHYNYVDSKGNNPITDSSLKKIVNKSIKQIEQENKLYYDRVRKNELLIHKYKQTEEYRRELILRATSVDRLCDTQTF
jgi:hypothetical protein